MTLRIIFDLKRLNVVQFNHFQIEIYTVASNYITARFIELGYYIWIEWLMVALCINGVSGLFLSCFHYCIGCSFSILQSWQMQRFCTSFNATLNINWKTKWGNTKIIFERMMRKLNTCKYRIFHDILYAAKNKEIFFPFHIKCEHFRENMQDDCTTLRWI